ncbi:MAG: Uma2 family endonuclease [Thermodesulfobacteriota bacterium]
MGTTAKREATYEDLYRIPEHMTGEIIDGELIVTPRPARRHAEAASSLGGELVPPYRFGRGGPGGWLIYDEPEIHLGKHVLVPDLGGWKRERLNTPPAEHRFMISPDWICEILSPGTARIDRIRKMRIYAEYGVPYAWIIDPILMTLEVFQLESGTWVIRGLHEGRERVRAEPFTEVEIGLANLWMEEPPGDATEPG